MARKRKTLPKDFEALCQAGDLDILKAVFDRCELDAYTGPNRKTAPCFLDCPDELIRWLVGQGLNVDTASRFERTPLWLRAGAGRDPAVLIELGADVNAADRNGMTPLHVAVEYPEIVRLLLAHGAQANTHDRWGRVPLHVAAGYPQTVQILLDHGAQVDARNRHGWTPLHMAASGVIPGHVVMPYPETVRLLIDHGAQIDARNQKGATPLDCALGTCTYDLTTTIGEAMRLLLHAGAATPTDIRERIDHIREQAERTLLRGVKRNRRDEITEALQALYPMFGLPYPTA